MTNFSLSYSFAWVFVCIAIGAGYAWIQYTKSAPWPRSLNRILAAVRAVLVALICFLLLEPFLRTITNYIEKPLMIIAVDNSESVISGRSTMTEQDILQEVSSVKNALKNKGYESETVDLDASVIEDSDTIEFDHNNTNLSGLLTNIKSSYNDQNIGGIVLFSDGIFNEGYSPLAIPNIPTIYSIGLGDTSAIKDLSIKEVVHNSTVYEGNTLQLEVQLLNNGLGNVSTIVHVLSKGSEVSSERITFVQGQTLMKKLISIPIKGSGKQSLKIMVDPVSEEYTELNNSATVYFDVINARKRILILSSAPNPDIKALKTSIEKNEYYEVKLAYEVPKELDYELIILHQYPDYRTSQNDKEKLTESKVPKWYIVGNASDFNYLISSAKLVNKRPSLGRLDQVRPVWNPEFNTFSLDESFIEWISDLPPVSVPYGLELNISGAQTILNRQIGNVVLNDPLLYFKELNDQRVGVLLGTGIWRWKLDEFRKEQSQKNFDNLISKTVQYLSSDATKKRFYVNTLKPEYDQGEEVRFLTEQYNAVFERITGNKVLLSIRDENGNKSNYSYVPLSENFAYTVSNLQEGIYSYAATTEMDSKKYSSSGQFVVRKLNKEALNPVADHSVLRKLAQKSEGQFYAASDISEFLSQIEELNPVSTIHSSETEKPLNNIKWVLIMLLILASGEWFLRKFYGGY